MDEKKKYEHFNVALSREKSLKEIESHRTHCYMLLFNVFLKHLNVPLFEMYITVLDSSKVIERAC